MGFAGEVATIGLPEVFSNIGFNRLTGVLTIRERSRRATLYFEDGIVRAFRAWPDRSLDYAALALEVEAVSRDDLARVVRGRRRRGSVRELLSGCRSFRPERFDDAVATTVRDTLVPLFRWEEATFSFEEKRLSPADFDAEQIEARIALDPAEIAADAARRVDDWDSIAHRIRSERDIFVRVESNGHEPAEARDGDARELLALLDGTRDVAALVRELPYGRFHVLRLLAGLAEEGAVQQADADELRALATAAEEAGDVDQAVRYLEVALEMEPDAEEGRSELVRALVAAGRPADAAREYKRLARAREHTGDIDGALSAYGQAAALSEQETGALERMLELYDERGNKERFFEVGMQLGGVLAEQGLLEESLDVYQRLLGRSPASRRLRRTIAATYIRLHEPKKAARELLHLARAAWEAGDLAGALAGYRNVLAVDRECGEAIQRVADMERSRKRTRKVRRRRRLGTAVVTLLLGAAAVQGAREWQARSLLHQSARAALAGIATDPDKSLRGAIALFADAARGHPYTTAAPEAVETLRTLLLAELARIRPLLRTDPEAAHRALEDIDAVELPEEVARFWRAARDRAVSAEGTAGHPPPAERE